MPGGDDLTERDVMVSRQRIVYSIQNGKVVARAWPKKRGPRMSPRQAAWAKRFALMACVTKNPEPNSFDSATQWAAGSGFLPRDVLHTAGYGNLIIEGEGPKVTTPTAKIWRNSNQALTANTIAVVNMTASIWDNNAFWSSTVNPNRLTVRAPGLYLVGAQITFAASASATHGYTRVRKNGTTVIAGQRIQRATNLQSIIQAFTLEPFLANDYIELTAESGVTGNLEQAFLWVVAITPEGVLP